LTLKEWTASESVVVEFENHGRHLEDPDVSRTLGWFTAMYPVELRLTGETAKIGRDIKAIKEQIRAVPDLGIGYGVSKYFVKQDQGKKISGMRFNYLGQFDKELNNELFSYRNVSTGFDSDPENELSAILELNAMVTGGHLNLELIYHKKAHTDATVSWLMNLFLQHLDLILEHVEAEEEIHFTSSDFDAVDLDDEELDALFY
jgi:surfactin family lipopeptide synthetase A